MDVNEAVQDFLMEQRLRGNSPRTVEFYEGVLGRFVEVTGVRQLSELRRGTVVRWRIGLLTSGTKPVTVRSYERGLRAWCTWLARQRLLDGSPFEDVPKVKVPEGQEFVTFSGSDVRQMMAVASRKGRPNQLRNQAMLALLLDTGVRAGELASVELHGVRWEERAISVCGKTGHRSVPAKESLRFLRRYISRERQSSDGVEGVFTGRSGQQLTGRDVTVIVRRIALEANVRATKLGPHTFRHTFALEYLRSGGDIFSLMRILGHSNLKTTEQYVRWLTGDVAARHAHHSPASKWLR